MADDTRGGPAPERMPLPLRFALGGVAFHAAFMGLGAWAFVNYHYERVEHGQAAPTPGVTWVSAGGLLLIGALLAACVVLTRRRLAWVRVTMLVLEWLMVATGLVNLVVVGDILDIALLALAVSVTTVLLLPGTRAWFSGAPRTLAAGPLAHGGDGHLGR